MFTLKNVEVLVTQLNTWQWKSPLGTHPVDTSVVEILKYLARNQKKIFYTFKKHFMEPLDCTSLKKGGRVGGSKTQLGLLTL